METAKEVFERQILDLSWCTSLLFCCLVLLFVLTPHIYRSWDGLTLYAVSSDGTLAAFAFDQDEMEGIAPLSAQEQYLTKFGFVAPPLPVGYSHTETPPPPNEPAVAAPSGVEPASGTILEPPRRLFP